MVMAMIGADQLARRFDAPPASDVLPMCRWRSMFSTMTMASSTTSPTDSTMASSVSRLIVKPNSEHQRHGADERDRDGDDRDDHAAHRPEEEEDDQDDDEQRLGQRLQHFVDRRSGCRATESYGMPRLHARGQLRLDLRHRLAHALHHFERVRGRQREDADEHRGLAVEAHFLS